MWLQNCIENRSRLAMLFLTASLCACSGPAIQPTASEPQRVDTSTAAGKAGEEALGPQIPAAVLTLYEQAAAAMASGDFVDAELRFKEFLLHYPGYPGAFVNLAIMHANNDNAAATRTSIDAALALDPNHPAALNQLGMLLRRNGKFLEAEAAYLKAVTVSPDYALAHYNLGVLNELYLQRLDVALQHFETYQALVGEDKQVARWIKDLRRRVEKEQRTAKVVE